MDGAADAGIIKNTMAVLGLHLHDRAGNPPILPSGFFGGQAQGLDHPFLIMPVEGDRGFAVAAETTASALKNIGNLVGGHVIHYKKKRRSTGESTS